MTYYIARSFWLGVYFTLFYIIAGVSIFLSNLHWIANVAILILLGFAYQYSMKLHVIKNHVNATVCLLDRGQYWELYTLSDKVNHGLLVKKNCFRNMFLLILCFKVGNKHKWILIPQDSLSNYQFRRMSYVLNSRIIAS